MLDNWASTWGMRFNPSKCQILHIARVNKKTKFYQLCGEILETVSSAKYLGVIVSDDLQWRDQVSSSVKKANSTLHLVARNFRNCSRHARSLAFTSLVRPKLEYCATVWDPYLERDKHALEMVNRRGARTVFNKGWRQSDVSPSALIKQLGWQTLAQRREEQRLCMMYKIAGGLIAIPPTRLQQPTRTTRGHPRKFNLIASTTESVRNSFYLKTIPQWNNLTSDIVCAESFESFKTKLHRATSAQ